MENKFESMKQASYCLASTSPDSSKMDIGVSKVDQVK